MRRLTFLLFILLFAAGGAFARPQPITSVPLRYERGAVLVDHVRINGQGDYTFLLDTGSTACTITPEVARELGLRKGGWSMVHAIGATRKLRMVKVKSITIGAATAESPLTLLSEDNGLSRHVGRPVHGVIGTPFLWKWPVEFDFPGRRFHVYPESFDLRTEPVESPWNSVGVLSVRGRAAYIKVALNGAQPREMMLDTGATGLVISDECARDAGARNGNLESTSIGPFGPRRTSAYWLVDAVRVAGLTVRNAQAFTPHSMGEWRSEQLGNDVLSQFRLTVDAAREVIRLERDQMPEWFDGYPWGFGIAVRRDMDAIRVARVFPESDAALKGVSPGDRLVAIGEDPAEEITDDSLREVLTQPPGNTVAVQVRSDEGQLRRVELRSDRYMRRRTTSDATIATTLSVVQPGSTAPPR